MTSLLSLTEDALPGAPRLTVIGTGYLGATHAICLAARGYDVLGVDVDADKIAELEAGRVPFFEPGLPELLTKVRATGRLRFTSHLAEAAAFGDVHFLCVGTPQRPDGDGADLRHVEAAVRSLAVHLTRPALVVGKSTVPVGTAAQMAVLLQELAPAGPAVRLAWNPEFLREGFAVADTMRPDRLVFGVTDPADEALLRRSYAPMIEEGTPVVVTDLATAELVKSAANSFLATKISFINAMAEICEGVGADVLSLSQALAYDARIGGRFLHPGLGFGGGCLPKDIRAFRSRAEELGHGRSVAFLREVDEVNLRCRDRVVELTRELVGGRLVGARVAVLGAAFKPDSDDVRDSPALDVATRLQAAGAAVTVTDPVAIATAQRSRPQLRFAATALEAATGADVVLLLTEWTQFRAIDPAALGAAVARRTIVDARNALDAREWQAAGWTYRALGRAAA